MILDTVTSVLVSRLRGKHWLVTTVRESWAQKGPAGYDWAEVEYRLGLGHWATALSVNIG